MRNIVLGSISLYELISYFFIYSFCGWVGEEIFHRSKSKVFVNRGFLLGPICPIYGCGTCLAILSCTYFMNHKMPYLVFLVSFVICSLIELVTGFVLYHRFDRKWWDYSNEKLNFKGYICLKFSLIWGIACTIFLYTFHRYVIVWMVNKIPSPLGEIIDYIFIIIFIVDLIFTAISLSKLRESFVYLDEIERSLKTPSDAIGHAIYKTYDDAVLKKEEIVNYISTTRFGKTYPYLVEKYNSVKDKLKSNKRKKDE